MKRKSKGIRRCPWGGCQKMIEGQVIYCRKHRNESPPVFKSKMSDQGCSDCNCLDPSMFGYLVRQCDRCYKETAIASRYGLTLSQLRELYATYTKCTICGNSFSNSRRRHIDHDHACCSKSAQSCGGCIRGVICGFCNSMLGYAQDNPVTLKSAAEYLSKSYISFEPY